MNKLTLILAVGLSISLGLQSCSQNQTPTTEIDNKLQGKLTLTGSSTVAPLASEIGKSFETQHPGVRIDVQTGGSSRGLADATQELADIGMVSRALTAEEEKNLFSFTIARDGIGIIVNENNPIESLSDREIVEIYTGKISNWQEVSGNNAPITVVNKAEGRSTLELFLKYFDLENSAIKPDTIIGDNQQGIKTVSGNKNAIGYVSIGAAEYEIEQNVPIKLLPVGGIEATTETVQDSSFPLSRPLNLVTKNKPSGLTKEFIEFAQSTEVYDLVKEQNFVPVETAN